MARKARTRKDTLPSSIPDPEPPKPPPAFVWVTIERSDTYERLAGDTPVRIRQADGSKKLTLLNEAPELDIFEVFRGNAWVNAQRERDPEVVTVTLTVELLPYGDISKMKSEIESRLSRQGYDRDYCIHQVTAKVEP
jgi:hypothetical protein